MPAMPNTPQVDDKRSDPLLGPCAHAGFTIVDCLAVGLSPITLLCNEAWTPLLALMGERFGYTWEWVTTEHNAPPSEGYARHGEAVLTKVGLRCAGIQ